MAGGGCSGIAPCAQRPCLRLGLVAGLAAAGAGAAAASWPERAEAATLLLRSAPGAPSRPRKGRAVAAIASSPVHTPVVCLCPNDRFS